VDGLVALGSQPKIFKTILYGNNTYTVDWIASKIIGFNPNSITYLKLFEKETSTNILPRLLGEATLNELRNDFPAVNYLKQKIGWALQLKMVDLYSKIVGDIVPPMLLKE
jgi:hypothetical protein